LKGGETGFHIETIEEKKGRGRTSQGKIKQSSEGDKKKRMEKMISG